MDSIAVTYALLDPIMTVVRPVAAFITASVTGLLVNIFDKDIPLPSMQPPSSPTESPRAPSLAMASSQDCSCEGSGCSSKKHAPNTTVLDKLKHGMVFSFGTLLGEIGPWLLVGVILAAIITVFISPEFIDAYLGSGLFSMVVMIFLATPLYVCATASTPIAAALALKGLSPGAALVFLLAGPATNMAAITVVMKILGKRTAIIYVITVMSCSLLLGVVVNSLYFNIGLSVAGWVNPEAQGSHGLFSTLSAVVLLFLIINPWVIRQYQKAVSTLSIRNV